MLFFLTLRIVVFCLTLIVISIIDIREYRIPDRIIFPLQIFLLLYDLVFARSMIPVNVLSGLFSFFLFYAIQRWTKGLGFGDVKLSGVIGYAIGVQCWFIASLCASLSGLLFCVLRTGADKKIPFSPFLSLGAFLSLILIRFF
jgi:leader peptidase (prepilin peptidase) / N-methyltransferase